ncbi:MAG: GGDEF domain-containing protein [Campylobacterales bacterium]|nr:GGDEF domain-containing protein [Campylobacterales bacterium]
MHPKNTVALATLAAIILYWAIDMGVFHGHLMLSQAFAQNLGSRGVVTGLLAFLGLLSFVLLSKEPLLEEQLLPKEASLHEAIIGIVFSPAPLHVRLEKSLQKVAQVFSLEQLVVAQYQSDALKRLYQLNETYPLAQTLMFSNQTPDSPLEKEMLNFHEHKHETHTVTLPLGGHSHPVCFVSLKADHLLKPSGILGAVFKKGVMPSSEDVGALGFLAQNIAFALSVAEKKEATLRANERQIEQQSDEDPRFDIFTNLKLRQIILYEIKRNQRHKTDLSLLLFGIDHFANLQGMLSPEKALGVQKEVSNLVKSSLRNTDVFGIWDENIFAIVLPDIAFQSANALAQKLTLLISKRRFEGAGKLTCSFGITTFISPEDTIETFRRRAESALEKAHKEGGNKTEIKLLVSANHKT